MNKISGNCLCGAVQYSSDAEPVMQAICHCEGCQRQTGTTFSIIIGVPEDSFTLHSDDPLGEFLSQGASGKAVRRKFCKNCGSPIVSFVESAPGLVIVKAGTLNDKSWLNPTIEFWCNSAQPWLDSNSERTKYDENPT